MLRSKELSAVSCFDRVHQPLRRRVLAATRGSPGCMCTHLQCTELTARHMGKRSKLSSKVPARPPPWSRYALCKFDAPARFARFWRVLDPREQLIRGEAVGYRK